jgi:nuclear pore complex protein Nup210
LQLNINPDSNTTIISLVGNTDVQIHCRNKGRLSISLIKRDDFGIAGHAQYKVNVLRSEQFTDRIIITLPATGQIVEIDVCYDTGESLVASSKDGYSVLLKILWGVLVLVVSVIILMKVIDRQVPTGATGTATYSGNAAQGTPERRSGTVIYHEESPRTPSPFMEYVKRTVDETPYYRREGRRRFNPQNTM